ncbi:MAG TPA: GGDEF domain-containing protein [Methylococcus sp.]|nr:GGDEF domain-containing protein [Methylococcus sp.]
MAQSKKNAPYTGTPHPPEPAAGGRKDSPTRIGIIGAGRGGSALLRLLTGIEGVKVVGICDIDPHAPGLAEAGRLGIPCYRNAEELVEAETMDWLINVSHTSLTQRVVLRQSLHGVEVIDGDIGELMWRILTAFDRLLDPGEGFAPSPAEFIRSFRHLAWQVVSEITTLVQHAHERLTEMACRDPLTGLYTRRILAEFLLQETVTSLRSGRPLGVMLIDLDHFKSVNDRFGHEAGDALLRDFADLLRGACRAGDIAARHGGEEFVVVLPGADAAASEACAERIRSLAERELRRPDGEPQTISLGLAVLEARKDRVAVDPEELHRALLLEADQALYQAKKEGRNRVILAGNIGSDLRIAPPTA